VGTPSGVPAKSGEKKKDDFGGDMFRGVFTKKEVKSGVGESETAALEKKGDGFGDIIARLKEIIPDIYPVKLFWKYEESNKTFRVVSDEKSISRFRDIRDHFRRSGVKGIDAKIIQEKDKATSVVLHVILELRVANVSLIKDIPVLDNSLPSSASSHVGFSSPIHIGASTISASSSSNSTSIPSCVSQPPAKTPAKQQELRK